MNPPTALPSILRAASNAQPLHIALFSDKVPAGFPSPAGDYVEGRLSLDESLIQNREFTFFVRAKGNSMVGAGIFDGDLLIVDKSLEPAFGNIVIAAIDGEFTVKRLARRGDAVVLKPENPRCKEIVLKEGEELQIFGVVTASIKAHL